MKQLAQAVAVFTDALCKVPGTQLQHIENTLRQLMTDLKKAGIIPPAELDDLIEEAAIAHFEDMAYYNGMLTPEQEELYLSESDCGDRAYEQEELYLSDMEEYYQTMYAEAYSLGMTPVAPRSSEDNDYSFWHKLKGEE